MKCEVCNKNESVGVASVPGVPISVSYCRECLDANAHPIWVLSANTAMVGRLDKSADWWKEMVSDTCKHLGISDEEFNKMVNKDFDKLRRLEEK